MQPPVGRARKRRSGHRARSDSLPLARVDGRSVETPNAPARRPIERPRPASGAGRAARNGTRASADDSEPPQRGGNPCLEPRMGSIPSLLTHYVRNRGSFGGVVICCCSRDCDWFVPPRWHRVLTSDTEYIPPNWPATTTRNASAPSSIARPEPHQANIDNEFGITRIPNGRPVVLDIVV